MWLSVKFFSRDDYAIPIDTDEIERVRNVWRLTEESSWSARQLIEIRGLFWRSAFRSVYDEDADLQVPEAQQIVFTPSSKKGRLHKSESRKLSQIEIKMMRSQDL